MNFRPLPKYSSQAMLRAACIDMQAANQRTYNLAVYYRDRFLERSQRPKDWDAITGSTKQAAITSQGILRERSAQERYMRGLDEGLVLDDPGPACSVCGGHSNVVHMGGSIPYLCDNPECIPF
ncbi:hypothetical protein RG2014_027 [Delftia phage RG-2014]|uniref:Uncharacterized protein n=1 Tax=Delftia phage RG-2014 TaxID=1563661 RepID=A0A097PBD2_9CAUD|nr:hypothetical protein RG2014_027 [Delftia phage RG-2014]AIU44281.1 hypothetical protein RG2014_027 [Delftia phage RG-2014]